MVGLDVRRNDCPQSRVLCLQIADLVVQPLELAQRDFDIRVSHLAICPSARVEGHIDGLVADCEAKFAHHEAHPHFVRS